MPKRVKRKQSILVKYAALFQTALLVPLIIVSIFFVPASSKILRERVLADKRAELSVYSEGLNRQIDSIFACAFRLSMSDNIYLYRLLYPTVYGQLIISDLRTNSFSSALLHDIYIVSPTLPFSYSSFSTYSFDRLAERLTNGAMDSDEYRAFLKTTDGERLTIIYKDNSILIYLHLPVSDMHSSIYIVFELTQQMLNDYLKDFPDNYHFSILSHEDTTIYETGCEVSPSDFVYEEHQSVLNWTFRFTILEKDIEQLAHSFRMTAYGLLLAVACLGGLLVSSFAYFSYKPLNNLRKELERLIGHRNEISASGNELQVIRQIALDLYGSTQSLMGKGRDAYMNFIILRLIRGVTADYHTERQHLSEFGLFTEIEYCLATVIYFDADESQDSFTAFWETYAAKNDKTAYAVFDTRPHKIIVLIFGDYEQADAYIPFLEKGRELFAETYGLLTTIGVGLAYPDIESVSLSYMQAVMAYEYRLMRDTGRVLLFNPENTAPTDCGKVFGNALNAFNKAAFEFNPAGITAAAARITKYISDTQLTVYAARAAFHYLAQSVSMVLYDLPYPGENTLSYELGTPDVVETTEGFIMFVQNLGEFLCTRISECERKQPETDNDARQTLSNQIFAYIDTNFSNNQLSVSFVAKQFELSISHVSRVFREEQGKTILEYLTEKRIALACELLRQTDKSIETIVKEIGYFDASSFIRKFKKVIGVTPGEYRKTDNTSNPEQIV